MGCKYEADSDSELEKSPFSSDGENKGRANINAALKERNSTNEDEDNDIQYNMPLLGTSDERIALKDMQDNALPS